MADSSLFPILVINDVTMTSLLLLKIINVLMCIVMCSWFYQTPCYLSIFCFMATSREIWTLPNNLWEILRLNDVKLCHVSIKLYLEMLDIISALIRVHLEETFPR